MIRRRNTTRIFDAFEDVEAWYALLAQLPEQQRDVYFTPEYVRLHVFAPASRALLFVYEDKGEVWAKPLILQPIPEDWGAGRSLFDIDAVYGYGGPVCTSQETTFLSAANEAFSVWCEEQGIVTEFVRFHPLLSNHSWESEETIIEYDRNTASTAITGPDELMSAFTSTVRNMIRRSRKAGLVIKRVPATEAMPAFVELYLNTMRSMEADPYYLFSDSYYEGLTALIEQRGWLVVAEYGGNIIGGSIFLAGDRFLHYHLSAVKVEGRVPGTTNALLFDALVRGHRRGLERLHLGGGATASDRDPLLRFKQSMSTDLHNFYIGKRVHQRERFHELRETWAAAYPEAAEQYANRILCYRYRTAS